MEPVTGAVVTEALTGFVLDKVFSAVTKCLKNAAALQDAVRGAENEKSDWYTLCKELGDNCDTISSLLINLKAGIEQSARRSEDMKAMEDAMDALGSALQEGADLVEKCRTASTTTLFMSENDLKKQFHTVANKIAVCLRNIPLAYSVLMMHIQNELKSIVERLESARFELCEEDRRMLKAIQESVAKLFERHDECHREILNWLMLIAQQQKTNISNTRHETHNPQGASGSGFDSRSAQSIRSGPPAYLLCPITLELMRDPVMDCFGHTYERSAIIDALLHKPGVSPNTNKPYPDGDPKLQTNYSVRDAVEAYMEGEGVSDEDTSITLTASAYASTPLPSMHSTHNPIFQTNTQDVFDRDCSHSFHGEASSSHIEKSSTSVQHVEFKDDLLHHRSTPAERSTATVASGGSPINQNGGSLSISDVPIQISTEDLSISPGMRVRVSEFVEFPYVNGRIGTCIERVGAQCTVVIEGEDQTTIVVHEKNLKAVSPGKRDTILPPPCSTPVVSTHAQEHVHGACRSPINSKPSSEDTFEANCEPQELGPLLQVVSANESQSGSSSSKPADHPNAPAATNRPQEPRTRLQDDRKNPIYEQPTKRNSFSLTCCRSMLFAFVLVIIVVVTILVGFALGWDGGDTKNNDSQEEGDVVRILSRVSFSRLDMAVLDDPVFAGGFRSHFTNAMATAAGVSSGSVSIGLISSGSVMVSSEIGFGSQAMAEAFFNTLLDNAGAIFMDTPLEQYGPVTVVIDHFSPALIDPKAPSPPSPRTPPPYFPPPPPASSTPSPQDVPSSTAPTATSTYSVFTFIHPCTNETLRSTTTTYLDFDSGCATTIPTQLGRLTMLTHLSFSSASSLTGTIPTQLAQLTALKHLSISGATALIGPIPSHFGQLTALTYLSFSSMTSVKGTIPTQLGQLTMIRRLSFYGATSLTGTIPTHFGQLTALTYLDFYYARSLTGTIPTQLGSMTMLSCLYFSSASSLKGTIPTQLGLLTSLTLLSFSSVSSLTGTIPTQLGQLTSLTRIDFTWARMIAGTIPTHFGQLTTLKFLSFYYAMSLSGTIPTQLGQLTSLKSLFFSYASSLTGTIPMHLGYLTALQSLDFSGALSLTGTIPVEVHQLTALTYCNDQSGKSFCVDV